MPRAARIATEAVVTANRRSGRSRNVVNYASQTAVEEHEETMDLSFEGPLTDLDSEGTTEPPQKRRQRRRAAATEPIVYDIPPVKTKASTFKGRLGYACLNTVLRTAKPDPIFCSRTCRIVSIEKNGLDFAKDLGLQNVRDLCKLIQWNEDNKIRFMRLSSEIFPFASHGKYGYSLDYAAAELKTAGDLANGYGHRLTLHPGQFTQIGSPKGNVVEASIRELEYHCSMLHHMGMGKDSVMIIHMGGVYGDKTATLERFKKNYKTKLSDEARERLVLENDEICYSADDLLPVCEELGIPLVFDYHHNWINPSVLPVSELITRINAIWEHKGIRPKQHLSSPRPGAKTIMEKRAHADRCYELPLELPDDMDLMIEAKDKEQAVLHLYRIYQLEGVIHENLRPEKSQEVQKVGGKRKSYNSLVISKVPEGDDTTSKKSKYKGSKKQTIEAVGPASIGTEGGAEEPEPDVVSARKNGRKRKESSAETGGDGADVIKAVRKRKKP